MEMVVTKSKKLLSIITVTKNNHDELKRTIESITGFLDYCSVELIVVNGGEKFRDQDNIFKNFNENDNIKILHGHDSGIYNAMNKGLRKSKGKYIWILNSGDEYAHEVQDSNDPRPPNYTHNRVTPDFRLICIHMHDAYVCTWMCMALSLIHI